MLADAAMHDLISRHGFQRAEPPDDPTIERDDLCREDVKVRAAARNLRGDWHASASLLRRWRPEDTNSGGSNNMNRNNSNDRTTAGVVAATAIIASIALLALT